MGLFAEQDIKQDKESGICTRLQSKSMFPLRLYFEKDMSNHVNLNIRIIEYE